MSAQQHPWERRLLAWAAEGLEYAPPVQAPNAGRSSPRSGLRVLR